MLKVGILTIKWEYLKYKSVKDYKVHPTEVKCIIRGEGYEKPLAEGYAKCSSKDQFSRDIGRRLSLARALAQLKIHGFDYIEERKKIWEAYRTMTKVPRWKTPVISQ